MPLRTQILKRIIKSKISSRSMFRKNPKTRIKMGDICIREALISYKIAKTNNLHLTIIFLRRLRDKPLKINIMFPFLFPFLNHIITK
jgi:hypothetical protein